MFISWSNFFYRSNQHIHNKCLIFIWSHFEYIKKMLKILLRSHNWTKFDGFVNCAQTWFWYFLVAIGYLIFPTKTEECAHSNVKTVQEFLSSVKWSKLNETIKVLCKRIDVKMFYEIKSCYSLRASEENSDDKTSAKCKYFFCARNYAFATDFIQILYILQTIWIWCNNSLKWKLQVAFLSQLEILSYTHKLYVDVQIQDTITVCLILLLEHSFE